MCVSKGARKAVPARYIYCAGISEYGITAGPEPERGEPAAGSGRAKSGGGPAKLCRGVSDSKAHGWRSAACDPQYGFVYQAEAGDGCRD